MSLRDRISFGQLGTFIPTGKIVHLGPLASRLGDIVEYGEAKTIRLVVGQNKGVEARNIEGRCADEPHKFTAEQVDAVFLDVRGGQVGKKNVGASRVVGEGWYKGDPEHSVGYEIAFIPNDREPTFERFQENVNELSLILAERFCQDSVLILRDDGCKKTVAAAEWEKEK